MNDELKNKDERHERDIGRIISFGLSAIGLATILSVISVETLDIFLKIGLYCFCLSVPGLICSGLAIHPSAKLEPESLKRGLIFKLYVIGVIASAIGVGAIVFHFGWSFGVIFLSASIVAVIAGARS